MKKHLIEYRSNNSGGDWWLNDDDWEALESNGWRVVWASQQFDYVDGNYSYDECGLVKLKGEKDNTVRWLDALATTAFKRFDSLAEAVEEFEKITGADVSDEGCSCCGEPHNLSVVV